MSWMIQILPVIVKVLEVYVDGPVIQCLYCSDFCWGSEEFFLRSSRDQSRNVGSSWCVFFFFVDKHTGHCGTIRHWRFIY